MPARLRTSRPMPLSKDGGFFIPPPALACLLAQHQANAVCPVLRWFTDGHVVISVPDKLTSCEVAISLEHLLPTSHPRQLCAALGHVESRHILGPLTVGKRSLHLRLGDVHANPQSPIRTAVRCMPRLCTTGDYSLPAISGFCFIFCSLHNALQQRFLSLPALSSAAYGAPLIKTGKPLAFESSRGFAFQEKLRSNGNNLIHNELRPLRFILRWYPQFNQWPCSQRDDSSLGAPIVMMAQCLSALDHAARA